MLIVKKVFFGFLWFIFFYIAACFGVGAVAGAIAGANDPEHAREVGGIAGGAAVAKSIAWILGGALVISIAGSAAGVLPGTGAKRKD